MSWFASNPECKGVDLGQNTFLTLKLIQFSKKDILNSKAEPELLSNGNNI